MYREPHSNKSKSTWHKCIMTWTTTITKPRGIMYYVHRRTMWTSWWRLPREVPRKGLRVRVSGGGGAWITRGLLTLPDLLNGIAYIPRLRTRTSGAKNGSWSMLKSRLTPFHRPPPVPLSLRKQRKEGWWKKWSLGRHSKDGKGRRGGRRPGWGGYEEAPSNAPSINT